MQLRLGAGLHLASHPISGGTMHGAYERLSALDAMFLDLEDPNDPLHIAVAMLFDARPLSDHDGRLDLERMRRHLDGALRGVTRMRQRVVRTPLFGNPVWVDDARFDLGRHVHHIRLPAPGEPERLRAWLGTWFAQPLARDRPLWDLCIVEGLSEHRFAIAMKVHHAVLDGIAGVTVLAAMFGVEPDPVPHVAELVLARAAPSRLRLVRDEARRRLHGLVLARDFARGVVKAPHPAASELKDALVGLASAAGSALLPAPSTSLNPRRIGPRRRYAWASIDLASVSAIRHATGVTVNDVVLATVAGALERFFAHRGETLPIRSLRVAVPASAHAATADVLGNEVSMMFASLPLQASDPRRHLAEIAEEMRKAKESRQTIGIAEGERMADWSAPGVLAVVARTAIRMRPYNLIVTNVPGPRVPFYFLDAPLLETYPLVPLYGGQALGIAVLSYRGRLFIGLNADADALPDIDVLAQAHDDAFAALRAACGVGGRAARDAVGDGSQPTKS